MKGIYQFLQEVRFELSKVIWPKKKEVIKLTLIVFIISAFVGLYLGMLDFGFTKLLELVVIK